MKGTVDTEWMLWAKRFKSEHEALLTRVDTLESECRALKQTLVDQEFMCQARASNSRRDVHLPTSDAGIDSRPMSQGTTVDDTTDPANISYEKKGPHRLLQESLTLGEYLESAEANVSQHSTLLANEFVNGMSNIYQRAELDAALEGKVWNWQTVRAEVLQMIRKAERRNRSRRSLEWQ